MKLKALIAALLCSIPSFGSDAITALNSSATELDEMVAQDKLVRKETVEATGKKSTELVPTLSVEKAAPVIASKLKLDPKQVAAFLKDSGKTISEIVMARALEKSAGKSWKDLLASKDRAELLSSVQEQKLTEKVKTTIDELYADVSFVAMDDLMDDGRAVGKGPGSSKGKGKEEKQAKEEKKK